MNYLKNNFNLQSIIVQYSMKIHRGIKIEKIRDIFSCASNIMNCIFHKFLKGN